jgi:hypothetical protein
MEAKLQNTLCCVQDSFLNRVKKITNISVTVLDTMSNAHAVIKSDFFNDLLL